MPLFMPRARQSDLHIASTGSDLVIHDAHHNHIHSLNPTAAAVWRAADGSRDSQAIATALSLPAEVVDLTVQQLAELDLLDAAPPVAALSRRQVVAKLAAAGIAASALPVIGSITGADATAAASCDPLDFCCSFPCDCFPTNPGCGGGGCAPDDFCCIDPNGPGCDGGGGCAPDDFCCIDPNGPGCGGGGCDPIDFCCRFPADDSCL